MLLLAGSSETDLVAKGAFQELDAITLLTSHTKLSVRPPNLESIPLMVQNAYRSCWFGRPGTGFVDLPADIIQGVCDEPDEVATIKMIGSAPTCGADEAQIVKIAQLLKSAKAPLIVLGKGAAYARAEGPIRELIDKTSLPFLPSPMGKGVVPDSHPCNTASARSTALLGADVVLILGARLNWIFHFGAAPKWNPAAKFIQVDISAEEIGRNAGDPDLGIIGDINVVVPQLLRHLSSWKYDTASSYNKALSAAKAKNEANAARASEMPTAPGAPLTYTRAYHIIKETLHSYSPPSTGSVVYIAEGANTMDISRSAFPVERPRLRLDAGTYATMGVGLGYAIAAHEVYSNGAGPSDQRKKIVAFEGDSAFGFSGLEVETMARYGMDCLIYVMNNGGVYHGDEDDAEAWTRRQQHTLSPASSHSIKAAQQGLRSTSLGYEVRYEKLAEACGGKGYFVRTEEELARATREGYEARVPVIVNVAIKSGKGAKLVSIFHISFASLLLLPPFDFLPCVETVTDWLLCRNSDGRPVRRKARRQSYESCLEEGERSGVIYTVQCWIGLAGFKALLPLSKAKQKRVVKVIVNKQKK